MASRKGHALSPSALIPFTTRSVASQGSPQQRQAHPSWWCVQGCSETHYETIFSVQRTPMKENTTQSTYQIPHPKTHLDSADTVSISHGQIGARRMSFGGHKLAGGRTTGPPRAHLTLSLLSFSQEPTLPGNLEPHRQKCILGPETNVENPTLHTPILIKL